MKKDRIPTEQKADINGADMDKIEVLMAVYNGSAYIREFDRWNGFDCGRICGEISRTNHAGLFRRKIRKRPRSLYVAE